MDLLNATAMLWFTARGYQGATAADVALARERVSAELAFIGYVEGIYLAAKGGMHVEAAATPDHHQGIE